MELTKELVKNWWLQTTGEAHYKASMDGLVGKSDKAYTKLRGYIKELVADDVLVHAHSKKDGYYRLKDVADEEVNWWDKDLDVSEVNLMLPFGLQKAVYIPRPGIVIIAGDTNAGKSAIANYILNINQELWGDRGMKVLISEAMEMFADRMKHAHPKCPIPPKFKTFKKMSHFEDDILKDGFTLIDYLRLPNPDSPMSIGVPLAAIADVINKGTGIVVVCLQKPRGERGEAYGGIISQWDSSLAISIHSTDTRFESYLKLNKIKKSLITDKNLYDLKIRFKIDHGIKLTELSKDYE